MSIDISMVFFCPGCQKNKGTYLETLETKKIKTSAACKARCIKNKDYEYFKWRKGKPLAKSLCYLQRVAFKKNFAGASGERSCVF